MSTVDIDSMEVVAELELPGRSRWALYDPERDHIFANIRDPADPVGRCLYVFPPGSCGAAVYEERD